MRTVGDKPEKVMDALDASASRESSVMDVGQFYAGSFHAIFSNGAALAGTLAVQGSNDPDNNSWDDISSQILAANSPLKKLFNLDGMGYRYARLTWTRTAGTGSLTAYFNAKG